MASQSLRLVSYLPSLRALRPRMVRAYTSSQSTQPPDLYSFLEHPDVLVLDVRSREEYDVGHIGSSKHIPVHELPERLDELPSDLDTPICAFCRIGQRSGVAKNFLEQVGYTNVVNGISLEKVSNSMDTNIVQS